MIDGSIDAFARGLATRHARRRTIGALGAAVLNGLPGFRGRVMAACQNRGQPCRRDDQCCAGGQCRRGKCRCKPAGAPCTGFAGCCSQSCDFLVGGGTCSPCRGQGCRDSDDCCGGLACTNSYCSGCRDRGTVCAGASDCCFSDCTSLGGGGRVCLSDYGGRCLRDADCKGCYLDGNCGTCVDGRCLG